MDYTLANLHEIFLQELRQAGFARDKIQNVFDKSFATIDNQLRSTGERSWHCGTTCTVGLMHSTPGPNNSINRTFYIGNVGDSRAAIIGAQTGGEALTLDHKASEPSEHARVTAEGGIISRGRVGGQLMLTR